MEQELDAEWDTPTHPSESVGGKVSWIWHKGVSLGKRILVAGFVVSTAPVVLPPLVVVSAIGIAFSLPYGFYLASYACTEKLMDKLLSIPAAPPVDYGLISDQDERQDQEEYCGAGGRRGYLGGSGTEGVIDVDEEENQQMEEAKIGDDTRIEFGEHEESHIAARNDDWRGFVEREDGRTKTEESQSDVYFDKARQDEVDIAVAGTIRGESPLAGTQGVLITVKGMDDDSNKIGNFETPFQVRSVMVDEFRNQNAEYGVEEQELEKETKVLLEKIQEATNKGDQRMNISEDKKAKLIKGMVDVDIGEMEEGKQVKEEEEPREQVEAVTMGVYQTRMETNENARGRAGRKAVKNRQKSNKSKAKSHTKQNVENLASEKVRGEIESLASSVGVRNMSSISIAGKSEISSKTVGVRENVREVQNPHLNSSSTLQEGTEILKETQLDEDEEIADESGLDLFDKKNQEYSGHAHEDVMALPMSHDFGSKTVELDAEKGMDSPSAEVIFTSEKICEQMYALRRIVGYQGTSHVSYAEELKALYIFTGVEPPASFQDSSSDLADITHKLQFLKSIVGIK